jgi:hypothetical protein
MKVSTIVALFLLACCSTMARADIEIESLDGPITAKELQSFKDFVRAMPRPKDNHHNGMVYGSAGQTTEGLGFLYEATHDREVLDLMVDFADHLLAGRNDPEKGRVLWTGKRELAWPNNSLNEHAPTYAGTENGDVISRIAFTAKLILQQPSLANEKPAIGDPFGYGATYMERARTYVRECDRTIDTFILPYFVSADDNRYYFPKSPLYATIDDRAGNALGKPVPWNQQFMLNGGFQRMAECHDLLHDAPDRVKRYDAIVQASCDWFLSELVKYDVNGHECYKWTYPPQDNLRHIEDVPHGGYDILICRAFDSGRYRIAREALVRLANTAMYVIYKGDGQFATRVDGANGTRSRLGGTWLLLSEFVPELYEPIAKSNLKRAQRDPFAAAMFLWCKNRRLATPASQPTK